MQPMLFAVEWTDENHLLRRIEFSSKSDFFTWMAKWNEAEEQVGAMLSKMIDDPGKVIRVNDPYHQLQ
jgi:hypothetical protein